MKIFNDPIYGHIELHPLLVQMIDTPQFQRLRHLKQLGTKYLIYPGATHTRFAHSIGVAYLAECLVKTLHENQPELNITKQDSLCVQIAALCYDLGHGPFSHLFDGIFIPDVRPDNKWQHEEASVQMFHCMRKKNGLDEVMKDYGLNLEEDIVFIEELMQGRKSLDSKWTAKGRPENKSFLYEIVANKLNGIDVDKWDYLSRDCHYLGIPSGFDHQRLLKSARVCKVDGRNHICFRDKVADIVYGMFHTRYTLHRQALQHKIGYIIDVKIKDALVLADGKLSPDCKISDAIDDMLEYTKLTDHIFDTILNQSDSEELKKARDILKDIVNRRLPKFVGEARLNEEILEEKMTKFKDQPKASMIKVQKKLKNHWEKIINNSNQSLNAEDFDIYVLDMGFGEVGNEPIGNVHFYSKNDLKTAFKLEKYQVSSLKPKRFHEYLVRVYYNKTDVSYQKVQQKAEESFHEWCKKNEFIDSGKAEETVRERSQNYQPSLGKIFNDPIYGQIELDPPLIKIIDTPEFQRLRHIKQLGGAYLVYPGATHTRFEHSLGMAYLAGRMINILKEKQEDLGIDEKDVLCVQIAALCYNLGHGPFSHLYERFYCDALKREALLEMTEVEVDRANEGIRQKQEKVKIGRNDKYGKVASLLILKAILNRNGELNDRIQENDLTFIQELIEGVDTDGKWKAKGRTEDKAFLYDIVINKWNGIDVCRWDYFARDCHYLGIPNSFDHQRMLKSARVCEVEGRKHICFRDKVADNVYDMFRTQYTLYSQAYQHKIVNIIEDKITEALSAAEDKITKISPFTETPSRDGGLQRRLSGSRKRTKALASNKERVAKMTKLTDHIFEEILYSTDDELKDARMKLEDVVRRRLPKCVGETRITQDEFKNKQILQDDWNKAVDEWNKLHPTVFLDKKDFSVDTIHLDNTYKEAENPINNVYFYRKRNPTEAFKIKKYEVSSLLLEEFTEYVGRVYYTKNSDEEEKDAKECFKWWRLGMVKILVYDEEGFKGNERLITKDCASLDCCGIKAIRSCKVLSGVWNLYVCPNYSELEYTLQTGKENHNPTEWDALDRTAPALSLRHERE
ncbi:uncharacterized protein LOC107732182 [Sinocyclocheilus rhinocerous]|uniref:uncharacterized protein LOC107732182 n=1 Tax=Sinocyclocheilus rhinocerous TaxID=307959 RepID=UPI0007BAB3C0|nr:PREDICTED: uncharacterized protein LOC107732182 [Sinocyclocheilus rhinocerous]